MWQTPESFLQLFAALIVGCAVVSWAWGVATWAIVCLCVCLIPLAVVASYDLLALVQSSPPTGSGALQLLQQSRAKAGENTRQNARHKQTIQTNQGTTVATKANATRVIESAESSTGGGKKTNGFLRQALYAEHEFEQRASYHPGANMQNESAVLPSYSESEGEQNRRRHFTNLRPVSTDKRNEFVGYLMQDVPNEKYKAYAVPTPSSAPGD